MAEHTDGFVAADSMQRAEVAFAPSSLAASEGGEHTLTLSNGSKSQTEPDATQTRVFRFGAAGVNTDTVYAKNTFQEVFDRDEEGTVIFDKGIWLRRSNTMRQADLEEIIKVLNESDVIDTRARAMLREVQALTYDDALEGVEEDYQNVTNGAVRRIFDTAIQIIAGDPKGTAGDMNGRKRSAVTNRGQPVDYEDSFYMQLIPRTAKADQESTAMEVQAVLGTTKRIQCTRDNVTPYLQEHIQRNISLESEGEISVARAKLLVEEALGDGTLCYTEESYFTYHMTGQTLTYNRERRYVVYAAEGYGTDQEEALVWTRHLAASQTVDFANPHAGTTAHQHSQPESTIGQWVPYTATAPGLTQTHAEVLSASLSRLDLLGLPTRWG